ncbi:hypothetical protein BGW38_005812 [Lunasporangiospora selenospora]|uniref:AB hydrolase-1 domain-containing protein n=1 Tax=Lunasporangiospora selenospora TaxID=979761 RepID=A0A9P6KB48_9FUNG|nr:hypothetical protein BGW38_005812 [Lunasporangiospora selenospora]
MLTRTPVLFRSLSQGCVPVRVMSSIAQLTPAVNLAFNEIPQPKVQEPARSRPIVIMHGLFGSKQNWKALSKAMATRLNTRVFTLDLRNHGESDHSPVHDYANMANDVAQFMKQQSLESPMVIGHSMGGKVAMNLALQHVPLDRLVVVDMAPVKVALSSEFAKYVAVMKEIQHAHVTKQSEADQMMQKVVPDMGVRQFLLTNLKRDPSGQGYSFRVPIGTLGDSLGKLGEFDFVPGQDQFDGKALFIKGDRSGYVREKELDLIKSFFPNARVEGLDTGHWVHAEKPDEFLRLVTAFASEP